MISKTATRILNSVTVLIMTVIISGCPYESKVGIDEKPALKVDNALLGAWEEKGSEDYIYTIKKLDDYFYGIEKKNIKDGSEPTIYRGFMSDIGGEKFFNVYESDGNNNDAKYYLYKITLRGNERITCDGVTDNITKEFQTSAELKTYIATYKHLDFFFARDEQKFLYRK